MDRTAEAALEFADGVKDTIKDLPEETIEKAQDYFDSVGERSEAIAKTIRSTQRCSENQYKALKRMYEGVRKWVHEED